MMELNDRDVNVIIETLRRNNYQSTVIHDILRTAWGEKVIGVRRIQKVVKQFEEGTRTSFDRKTGSGRKRDNRRDAASDQINELVREDGKITTRELADICKMSQTMVYKILTEDLQFKCLSDKWIPHLLSDNHKAQRVRCCTDMLQLFNDTRNIRRYLVVTDEKYFFSSPLGNSVTRKSWVPPDGDRIEIPKRMSVDKKFLALVAVNFAGLSHFKILPRYETVDSEKYVAFLEEVITTFNSYELIRDRRSVNWASCFLMQDNARPHVSRQTLQFLERKQCTLVKQPVYSPDTNICDRMLFPKLEMKRSQITFETEEELQQYLTHQLNDLTPQIMEHEFDILQIHLRNIIDNNGNYT